MQAAHLPSLHKQLNILHTVIFALCLASSIAFGQAITDIAVNDDETLLLTAQGKTAKLWEIATEKVIREFVIPEDDLSLSKGKEFGGKVYAVNFYGS